MSKKAFKQSSVNHRLGLLVIHGEAFFHDVELPEVQRFAKRHAIRCITITGIGHKEGRKFVTDNYKRVGLRPPKQDWKEAAKTP